MKILSYVLFIEAAQEACSPKHLADCGVFDDCSSKKDIGLSHISVDPDHPDHHVGQRREAGLH